MRSAINTNMQYMYTPQLPHLHVVEDEEEGLNREPLKELKRVKMGRRVLVVVVGCGVWRSLQVWPVRVCECVRVCVCVRVIASKRVCVCVCVCVRVVYKFVCV